MNPDSKLSRRGFVALTGAASLSALLAACGGGDDAAAPAAPAAEPPAEPPPAEPPPAEPAPAEPPPAEAPPAEAPPTDTTIQEATPLAEGPTFDPASEPDGEITFFEWAGYDETAPWMWQTYLDSEYQQKSPLKWEFLENDIQALAKVASGYSPDVIHPCIAYWPDFNAAGLIQPFDHKLLPDYEGIPEAIRAPGVSEDGLLYHVPFDIGFSSIVYRADKIPIAPEEESWSILLDPAYEGKLATYSDPVTIIKIGALINAGEPIDPNKLTSEQIQAAKETMIQAKPQIRNFWSGNQDNINDFINGNVWATYMWPDGYLQAIRHEKLQGVDVRYMWPKEGRLAWVCGFVLHSASERPGRATLAVAATNTPQAAASLTDIFAYGAAQQEGVQELIQDRELISIFSLDDPSAFAPPRAWFEAYLPNRQEYSEAGEAVKAA